MEVKDLSDKLTVFVIAVEKGNNYNACLKALKNQTVKFQIKKILDTYPMSAAFNEMLKQCNTEYGIQCDEDMILNFDAVKTMYDTMVRQEQKTAFLLFQLFDVHLEEVIRGIRIFRSDVLKNFMFKNTIACESIQKLEMKQAGYQKKLIDTVVGKHSPYWNNATIFQRYFNYGERWKKFRLHKEVFPKLLKKYKMQPNELNLYALLGAMGSLLSDHQIDEEKDFQKYETKQYQIIKEIFND